MNHASVAIIGTGTVGSMALWQLARQGVDVVGFDLYSPGHGNGGAGGDTRLYRVSSEQPRYIPITIAARDEWQLLEAESGMSLLELCGALYVGSPEKPYIRNAEQNAADFATEHEQLTPTEFRERYPQIPIDDSEVAIFESQAGWIRAAAAIAAAADTAVRMGARLLTGTRVDSIDSSGSSIVLGTTGGEWTVDKVIFTTGAWANELLSEHLPYFDVRRASVHWYPLRHPELFTPDRYPIFENGDVQHHFATWPTADMSSIKVSLMTALEHIPDVAAFNADYPAEVERLTDDYVRRFIPDAIPFCIRNAFGMDSFTQDGAFVVGPATADQRIILGVGMNGRGFKTSPAIGRALAEFAMTGESTMPVADFTPARFSPWPTAK